MNIAVLGYKFIDWTGGRDFLMSCMDALYLKMLEYKLNIYLLLPKKLNLSQGEHNNLQEWLVNVNQNIKVVVYQNLRECLNTLSIDVIIPSVLILDKDFSIPWVGYIYDCQHKYFPQFFTCLEYKRRDKYFHTMLSAAKAIIVSSQTVKEDLLKFYPDNLCQIFVLPPAVRSIPQEWLIEDNNVIGKYCLPQKYFVISNQFWIHKDHATAFKALSILNKQINNKMHLVCTGNTYDFRFPSYLNYLQEKIMLWGIKEQVHILGYIPKYDQIQIMRQAKAIIQPTLFEGAPGAAAVREALALGVPAIISDIPVNKELIDKNVIFFHARSAEDLAKKMHDIYEARNWVRKDESILREETFRNLALRANKLIEAITFVTKIN